jgi:hypothetical protein
MKINPIANGYIHFCPSPKDLEMIKALKADPNWENNADCASERLINENLSYVVSQGTDVHLFDICYLNEDGSITRATFTLEQTSGQWHFKNGFDFRSSDFKDIIDYMMQPH